MSALLYPPSDLKSGVVGVFGEVFFRCSVSSVHCRSEFWGFEMESSAEVVNAIRGPIKVQETVRYGM